MNVLGNSTKRCKCLGYWENRTNAWQLKTSNRHFGQLKTIQKTCRWGNRNRKKAPDATIECGSDGAIGSFEGESVEPIIPPVSLLSNLPEDTFDRIFEGNRLSALPRKSLVKEYRAAVLYADRPKGDKDRDADFATKDFMINAIIKAQNLTP